VSETNEETALFGLLNVGLSFQNTPVVRNLKENVVKSLRIISPAVFRSVF